MRNNIKIIGFDADDTLWVNEPLFRDTEKKFCTILKSFADEETVNKELFRIEMQNLEMYGYGVKGFMLCMIETAYSVSKHHVPASIIEEIIKLGKSLLNEPVVLLDNVEKVLQNLSQSYTLIVATKGDLLDQERKLRKSGLGKYFHHVEIMSDKTVKEYSGILHHLDINASNFVMIGNSLKSDILPVLELGGYAIHIPYHTTWIHEHVDERIENPKFRSVQEISELETIFNHV